MNASMIEPAAILLGVEPAESATSDQPAESATLRDQFAMSALGSIRMIVEKNTAKISARHAYQVADWMMIERQKAPQVP